MLYFFFSALPFPNLIAALQTRDNMIKIYKYVDLWSIYMQSMTQGKIEKRIMFCHLRFFWLRKVK